MTAISKLAGPGTVQTSVQLPPRSSAPRVARKLVRDLCTGSGLPDNLVDDAALVIGELVTTSVRQAHMAVQVVVVVAADEVTVRVYDKGTMPPAGLTDRPAAGRSWDTVRRLGTSWGYHGGAGGRAMWASFRANRSRPTR